MEKILLKLGGVIAVLFLTLVKVAFWVYLFYVTRHFAVKFW